MIYKLESFQKCKWHLKMMNVIHQHKQAKEENSYEYLNNRKNIW